MIELNVEIVGAVEMAARLDHMADLPMTDIHRAMGKEAADRIHDRTFAGKTLDGGAMPPSLRAMAEGGITLKDTGQMLDQSMGVKSADKRQATVGFDADRAKIAYWNHGGAKTKNGKWRPRPRPFFGFGAGDKEAITEAGQEVFDLHVKKNGGQ